MMSGFLASIALPFVAAGALWALPRRLRGAFVTIVAGAVFALIAGNAAPVLRGESFVFSHDLTAWFGLSFIADTLAVFMALVSSLVVFLIAVSSMEYMREGEYESDFYFWMSMLVGAMMGLIFSSNLILMFCFWEVTSVCSWRLIGFYRTGKDIKAADKAFLATFFGASLMLAGIIFLYLTAGTVDILALRGASVTALIAWLLLAGVLSKSAQLPLQSWFPDAGVAPTPIVALLHVAMLVPAGIYVFARLFCVTLTVPPSVLHLVIILAALTILVAAGSALVENNMKRILAYSTISQLGYILLTLSLNTDLSLKVAAVYILAHSLAITGLFLCVGIIEGKTHAKDIRQMGGLLHGMPLTATAYLLCAFSIIGIPPLLGFWPKFLTIFLAVGDGHVFAAAAMTMGAVFTLLCLSRLFNHVFLGEKRIDVTEEGGSPMVVVVTALGMLLLVLGFLCKVPFSLVETLAR